MIAKYYQKPITKAKETKEGDWVYDQSAELCYVTKRINSYNGAESTVLHSFGIEAWVGDNTELYPLTLQTKYLAERMYAHRQKYHKANIMNSTFSSELEEEFSNIMHVNEEEKDAADKYDEIWDRLNARFAERLQHARALMIVPKSFDEHEKELENGTL